MLTLSHLWAWAFLGLMIVFFVIGVAAAEASVGLAIFVALFRAKKTIEVDRINLLKW